MKLEEYQINGWNNPFFKECINVGNLKIVLLNGSSEGAPKGKDIKISWQLMN